MRPNDEIASIGLLNDVLHR